MPFKKSDRMRVKKSGNFSKLLTVRADAEFEVSGKLVPRLNLGPARAGVFSTALSDIAPDDLSSFDL